MRLVGKIEADRVKHHLGDLIAVTLILLNPGNREVYVFVPHGRGDGLQIAVRQTAGFRLKDLMEDPDAGLVPEISLAPAREYRKSFPLSQWLIFTEPGTYDVRCTLPVRVASASLRQTGPGRIEETVTISSALQLRILPI